MNYNYKQSSTPNSTDHVLQHQARPSNLLKKLLKRSSISRKISCGYALALGIAMLGTTSGLIIGNSYQTQAKHSQIRANQQAQILIDLQIGILEMRSQDQQFIRLLNDPQKYEFLYPSFQARIDKVKILFSKFESYVDKSFNTNATDITDLGKFLQNNKSAVANYLQTIETLLNQIAPLTLKAEVSPNKQRLSTSFINSDKTLKLDAFSENLTDLISLAQQREHAAEIQLNKAETLRFQIIVLSMLLSAIAAIILAIYTSRAISEPINQAANQIASFSTEIATTIAQQERMASQQAVSVNQTTVSMDEFGASSKGSAEQAELAATVANQTLALAQNGSKRVEQSLEGMLELKDKVAAIATQITQLSEQTNQIGTITTLVTDLANQTNMLALNASIEAVRAGEHGKGFAIIASEIRHLADRSKQSTDQINNLVNNINKAINSTVRVTKDGTQTVAEGMQLAQGTAGAFTGVADGINTIVVNNKQIFLNARQQALAVQQVIEAMNNINRGAVETASSIAETKTGSQKLSEAAQILKNLV